MDSPGSRVAWEQAAAAVLRKSGRLGADDPDSAVWDALTRTTLDDIAVTPLGTPELVEGLTQGLGAPSSQRGDGWDIRTPLAGADPKEVNQAALVDLDNGATSLFLDLPDDLDLAVVLRGVLLDVAPVVLQSPSARQATALADLLESLEGTPDPGANLSADPETTAMLPHRVEDAWTDDAFVDVVRRAQALGVLGVVVDGTALHDRGASDAQELGWSMAVAVHYLRILTAAGFSVDDAAGLMEFRYSATDEQFPTIAKLRAARRLWARVLDICGGQQVPQRQHVVTSRPMMSKYDPWANMLRTTVAAFSAGVGGADSVTVLPFDSRLGQPDAFGRRIARNTSALLIAESHLGAVADPAAGAFAVEKLTDDLARAGWAELDRIEADGGVGTDSARDGLKARVSDVAARRDAEVASRARPITGLSEFPNLEETLPTRTPYPGEERRARPYGHAFEALRDEPVEEQVFLATMGTVAAHTARASFAANLLAAGGITTVNEGRHDDVDAVLAHYRGERVVCLAGNDKDYAAWGTDLAQRLREAGAEWVIVAGQPLEGTDDNCAKGVDALDFLNRTREHLS